MAVVRQSVEGSAGIQGKLWGARAEDWADIQEPLHGPLFLAILNRIGPVEGKLVVDVGCGAGGFCRLAAEREARVQGLDASEELIALAGSVVPGGEFRVGDMEDLPYPDSSADAVTAINSVLYAANPLNAMAELRRVAKPGAPVVIATWGRPEECDAMAMFDAVKALAPPPTPSGPSVLSDDGVLEKVARKAGLTPRETRDVTCAWEYPDHETAMRAMTSSGAIVRAIQLAGEDRVHDAMAGAIAPFRTTLGGYRLENKFRFLLSTA